MFKDIEGLNGEAARSEYHSSSCKICRVPLSGKDDSTRIGMYDSGILSQIEESTTD